MGAETESGSKPNSIISIIRRRNVPLVLRSSLFKNSLDALDFDIKSVLDNLDLLPSLFTDSELSTVTDTDALYCFLLTRKVSKMKVHDSQAENGVLHELLNRMADMASGAYHLAKDNAIQCIKRHKEEIFPDPTPDAELEYASLDFILDFLPEFDQPFFEYVGRNCFNLVVYRFNELDTVFNTFPDLFSSLFTSDRINLEQSSCVAVLEILKKKYKKENARYKNLLIAHAADLYQKALPLCKALSEDNVLKIEPVIKSVNSFLHTVKSPEANDFSEYVNTAEKLQRKVSDKRTESIKDLFSCPVEIWKSSNRTLLDLTHTSDPVKSHLSTDEDSYKCIDLKQCCTDILEGNFLCEGNFQDERYRFDLQLMESCHSATFLGILYDQAALDKFACLLKHAIKSVSVQMSQKKWMAKTDSEKMSQTDDGLSEDTELLISMLGSVAKHVDEPDDNEGEIFCYSTSMFLCSLAEKLLRLLYIHLLLLKGEDVPSDIRLGMLLSANNDKMTKVFGSVHIQLLACFLIGMPGIKSGPSYRTRTFLEIIGLSHPAVSDQAKKCADGQPY